MLVYFLATSKAMRIWGPLTKPVGDFRCDLIARGVDFCSPWFAPLALVWIHLVWLGAKQRRIAAKSNLGY